MNITTRWTDASQTILHIHFRGSWSLDDFYLMIEAANRLTNGVDYPYIVIADLTNTVSIPARILSSGTYLEGLPNKAHTVVVVGTGHFLDMTLRNFQQQFPASMNAVLRCDTLGDAYKAARDVVQRFQHA